MCLNVVMEEILRNIFYLGKVCPEKATFMFGSKQPLPGNQITYHGKQ